MKRRLFLDKGQPHSTVVLNWHGKPEGEFTFVAEAFRLAGQEALAAYNQNPRAGLDGLPTEDFHAYPIVFLYRHALELYMKAVILTGMPMLNIKGMPGVDRHKLLNTHSLDRLRQHLERIFEAYGLTCPHFLYQS